MSGAYAGFAGSVTVTFLDAERAGEGIAYRDLRGGISQWAVRVMRDSAHVLLTDYSLAAGEAKSRSLLPCLRRPFPNGAQAEIQLTGHWDPEDNPFSDPGRFMAGSGIARDSADARVEIFPTEGEEGTGLIGLGYVLGMEWGAQVRSLVTFSARIALESLEYRS